MGFNSVYGTLQELFPQVDARLLKAAAIEHSKDPDGAVEFILTVVIPGMRQFDTFGPVNGSLGSSVECEKQCFSARASSSKHESTAAGAVTGSKEMNPTRHVDPACLNEAIQDPLDSTFHDVEDIDGELSGNTGSKELTLSKTCGKTGHEVVQDVSIHDISLSPTVVEIHNNDCDQKSENSGFGETSKLQKYQDLDLQSVAHSALSTCAVLEDAVSNISLDKQSVSFDSDFDPLSGDSNVAVPTQSQKQQPIFDGDSLYGSNYVELVSLSVKDPTLESLDYSIQSDVQSGMSTSKLENSEFSCMSDAAFKEDIQVPDNVNIEESSSAHTIVTPSGPVCSTDLLENIIEESKSHKKKLLSDMESVLKLMREVEFQEKVAAQTKKQALSEGMEIRAKVAELKSMLKPAREAYDTHSGEVYGERAILATEMRELHSRLLALSDLKEKSLSILDVMRQALEVELAATEMKRIAAEKENYEMKESAQEALTEQELMMEKVAQESKILQQEAEENAKLREFLMDRGRAVDTLQGEISVICKDIKFLKEKFGNRDPLNQSLSSEKTSCIFASSGSARKSTESEQASEHAKSSTSSVEPIPLPSVEQLTTNTQKELLDEGWELFEDAV